MRPEGIVIRGCVVGVVVLLDVDGVLNAMSGDEPPTPTSWTDWRRGHANGFNLWVSPSMARAVADLGDVRWLTTWNVDGKVNLDIVPLVGIGPFPVAATPTPLPDEVPPGGTAARADADPPWLWKPRAVADALDEGHRVVWFDDESEDLWQDWLDVHPRFRRSPRLFRHAPYPDVGLLVEDCQRAAQWVEEGRRRLW